MSNLKFPSIWNYFSINHSRNINTLVIFVLLYLHQIVELLLLIIYQQKYFKFIAWMFPKSIFKKQLLLEPNLTVQRVGMLKLKTEEIQHDRSKMLVQKWFDLIVHCIYKFSPRFYKFASDFRVGSSPTKCLYVKCVFYFW